MKRILRIALGVAAVVLVLRRPWPRPFWVNVKDYGAVGDGVADDTAAIRRAVQSIGRLPSRAIVTGGVIYYPPGTYVSSHGRIGE
jgi:hypothetical protein